jgi:hypothetical protein
MRPAAIAVIVAAALSLRPHRAVVYDFDFTGADKGIRTLDPNVSKQAQNYRVATFACSERESTRVRSIPRSWWQRNNLAGKVAARRIGRSAPDSSRSQTIALTILLRMPAMGADDLLAEARALNQNAITLFKQGRYAEAEPPLKLALAILEEVLGPEHRDVAGTTDLANREGPQTTRLGSSSARS